MLRSPFPALGSWGWVTTAVTALLAGFADLQTRPASLRSSGLAHMFRRPLCAAIQMGSTEARAGLNITVSVIRAAKAGRVRHALHLLDEAKNSKQISETAASALTGGALAHLGSIGKVHTMTSLLAARWAALPLPHVIRLFLFARPGPGRPRAVSAYFESVLLPQLAAAHSPVSPASFLDDVIAAALRCHDALVPPTALVTAYPGVDARHGTYIHTLDWLITAASIVLPSELEIGPSPAALSSLLARTPAQDYPIAARIVARVLGDDAPHSPDLVDRAAYLISLAAPPGDVLSLGLATTPRYTGVAFYSVLSSLVRKGDLDAASVYYDAVAQAHDPAAEPDAYSVSALRTYLTSLLKGGRLSQSLDVYHKLRQHPAFVPSFRIHGSLLKAARNSEFLRSHVAQFWADAVADNLVTPRTPIPAPVVRSFLRVCALQLSARPSDQPTADTVLSILATAGDAVPESALGALDACMTFSPKPDDAIRLASKTTLQALYGTQGPEWGTGFLRHLLDRGDVGAPFAAAIGVLLRLKIRPTRKIVGLMFSSVEHYAQKADSKARPSPASLLESYSQTSLAFGVPPPRASLPRILNLYADLGLKEQGARFIASAQEHFT